MSPDPLAFEPVAHPGLVGYSWLRPAELDWLIARLPDRGLYVEVGTASGVTAALVADARPGLAILCVDPFPDADAPHVAGVEPARPDLWRRNRRPNMSLWLGELRGISPAMGRKADAVLVDAGHLEHEVYADLADAAWMLRQDGVLYCHDCDDPGHPAVGAAVERFRVAAGLRDAGRCLTLRALERSG